MNTPQGRWDGDVWIFDPPITVTEDDGQVHQVSAINFADMTLPDDISRDDVVHAIANSMFATSLTPEEAEELLARERNHDQW